MMVRVTPLSFPLLALVFVFWARVASSEEPADQKEGLSIELAKFEIMQIYLAQEVPPPSLSRKYPEVRRADKAERQARKDYSDAVQAHPQLKNRFEEVNDSDIGIPQKMKLWQPLYEEGEKIKDLAEIRNKYNQARINSLEEQIKALRTEGLIALADSMAEVLARVESPRKVE